MVILDFFRLLVVWENCLCQLNRIERVHYRVSFDAMIYEINASLQNVCRIANGIVIKRVR